MVLSSGEFIGFQNILVSGVELRARHQNILKTDELSDREHYNAKMIRFTQCSDLPRSTITVIPCRHWVKLFSYVLKEIGGKGMRKLTQLINKIYETGEWPNDFLDVTMIPLKKKQSAKKCSDHRTISLISHVGKIVARILN